MDEKQSIERKVIPLNAKYKKQLLTTTPNDLRAAATGTIAFLLFLMVGFNYNMFEVKRTEQVAMNQKMERGIASVPKLMDPQWQRSLSHMNKDMIAQAGHKPTALESLNFGILEGKYAMRLEGGRLMQIELSDIDKDQPKVLSDRMSFIQEYAKALAPGFKSVEKMRIEASAVGTKETYKVDTAQGTRYFEFQLDGQKRFISLDIK
jgi:hypothetical protein